MYILDMEKLLVGDIILTAELGAVSKAVRIATGCKFSHAILYVGGGSYIHSDGQGVHANNIQRIIFDKKGYVEVLRVKNSAYINEACIFARCQIGKEYSIKDAINTKNLLPKKKKSNRQFCSRLVAQAYESSGIKLVENASYCTPRDIKDSPFTNIVTGCLRKATEYEVEFAKSLSPIQRQTKITNEILSSVRKLTSSDIQTFEELAYFVIDNPSFDAQITNIIQTSGYLNMWEYEFQKELWRYDGEVFLSLDIDSDLKKERAKLELSSALDQVKLYHRNYENYQKLLGHYYRTYFEINMVLYKKLINQMNKRIEAARYVIKHT